MREVMRFLYSIGTIPAPGGSFAAWNNTQAGGTGICYVGDIDHCAMTSSKS